MPWNNNIPQPTDKLSQSQQDILNNFQAINTLVSVNHGTFGANDQGLHKFIQLPQQVADPTTVPPIGVAAEVALYSKNDADTGDTELFFRRTGDGAITSMTSASLVQNGWSRLPSGLLMNWGKPNVASGGQTIVFNKAFSACFSVIVTSANPGNDIKVFSNVSNITAANFDVRLRGQNGGDVGGDIYYVAVGM